MSDFKVKIKCTKIDFGWGSVLDPAGELTARPRSPSWNKMNLLLKKREECREGKGRK